MPFVTYKCSAEILSGKSVYKHASSGYIESVDTNVFVSRLGGTATEVPSYVDLIMRDNYQIYVGDIVCQMTSYDNSSKHFNEKRKGTFYTYFIIDAVRRESSTTLIDPLHCCKATKESSTVVYGAEEIIIREHHYYGGIIDRVPGRITITESTGNNVGYTREPARYVFTRNEHARQDFNVLESRGMIKPAFKISELLVEAVVHTPDLRRWFAKNAREFPRYISARILSCIIRESINVFEQYDLADVLCDIVTYGVRSRYVNLLNEQSALAIVRDPSIEADFNNCVMPIVINGRYVTEKMAKVEIAVVAELWNLSRLKAIQKSIYELRDAAAAAYNSRMINLDTLRRIYERIQVRNGLFANLLMMKNILEHNSIIHLQDLMLEYSNMQQAAGIGATADMSDIEVENQHNYREITRITKLLINLINEADRIELEIAALEREYDSLTAGDHKVKYASSVIERAPATLQLEVKFRSNINSKIMMDVLYWYALLGVNISESFMEKYSAYLPSDYIKKYAKFSRTERASLDLKILRRQSPEARRKLFTYDMLLAAVSFGLPYLKELHEINVSTGTHFIKREYVYRMAGVEENVSGRNICEAVRFLASTGMYFTETLITYQYYDFKPTRANVIEEHNPGFKRAIMERIISNIRGDDDVLLHIAQNVPKFIVDNPELIDGNIVDIIYKNRAFQLLIIFYDYFIAPIRIQVGSFDRMDQKLDTSQRMLIPHNKLLMNKLPAELQKIIEQNAGFVHIPKEVIPDMFMLKEPHLHVIYRLEPRYLDSALRKALGNWYELIPKYLHARSRYVAALESTKQKVGFSDYSRFRSHPNPIMTRLDKMEMLESGDHFDNVSRDIDKIATALDNIFSNIKFNPSTDQPKNYDREYLTMNDSDKPDHLSIIEGFLKCVSPFHELISMLHYKCTVKREVNGPRFSTYEELGYPQNTKCDGIFFILGEKLKIKSELNGNKDFRNHISDKHKHSFSILYEAGYVS